MDGSGMDLAIIWIGSAVPHCTAWSLAVVVNSGLGGVTTTSMAFEGILLA